MPFAAAGPEGAEASAAGGGGLRRLARGSARRQRRPEFLYAIPRALRPRRVVVLAPCPTDYWRAGDFAGAESEGVLSSEAQEFAPDPAEVGMRLSGADMAFLGNPNDPTGVAIAGRDASAPWRRNSRG